MAHLREGHAAERCGPSEGAGGLGAVNRPADPPTSRRTLVLGIALVAFSLRTALASVGPIVEEIRLATGLSSSALGLLTTLPLLAFGTLSIPAARLGERVGMERAIALGLLLIGAGTALRSVPSTALLYLGTALLGVGIATGNVLLPALAKRSFRDRVGPITSLYTSMMGVGAAFAAGWTVPLAQRLGWHGALGVWTFPVGVALLVWLPRLGSAESRPAPRGGPGFGAVLREPLTSAVAAYLGLQSASFYVLLAWLPSLLVERGLTEPEAGALAALSQVTGLAGSIAIPLWAGWSRDPRRIVAVLAAAEAIGLVGLLQSNPGWDALWVGILGAVLGGTFALALTLIVLRAPDAATAGKLSGLAQTIGYLLAAGTPPLFGVLHDRAESWAVVPIGLLAVLVAKGTAGMRVGRPASLSR